MNVRPLLVANGGLIAVMAGLSAWAWNQIPDDAKVPVHWNIEGVADRMGSKTEALLVMPGLAALITLLLLVLPYLDPRRAHLEASGKFWNAVAIGVVLLMAYLHALLIMSTLGRHIDMLGAMIPALSLLSLVIGNYLAKTRSNWFAGIRTPWTLSSEYSWEMTHRWSGRLFVMSGLLSLTAWLLIDAKVALVVYIASLLATSLAGAVMSYFFWRNDPNRLADG
jgi:immunity protein, SdpI family